MNAEKISCRFTSPVYRLLLFCSVAALALALIPTTASAQSKSPYNSKANFCGALGKTIQASSGAQMYCFGKQQNGLRHKIFGAWVPKGPANVDAANPGEDISPNGTQAYGQSETSISAIGPYVVEAWNDATGFFSPCPSPQNKEELTGFGFSNNGGKTFTDMGGLPNDCTQGNYSGDPSVQAYTNSGLDYFYVASLYSCFGNSGPPCNSNFGLLVAIAACNVAGSGSTATLNCGGPTVISDSPSSFSFLDKDFLTIDPVAKRLYVTYTDFFPAFDDIVMGSCDISVPLAPVCTQASGGYLDVSPFFTNPNDGFGSCEQEGAYPALDPATGDVYVAWENNWATNLTSFGTCAVLPVSVQTSWVPSFCLPTPPLFSSCVGPFASAVADINSMDAAFIPGYNRFPMNDFPRIAVSDPAGTVSIVWNDTQFHPQGDIKLQSYSLGGGFVPSTSGPVILDNGKAAFHFLPALRNSSTTGLLNVTWYDRRLNPNSAKTDVFAAANVSPTTSSTPSINNRITNFSSDWLATSSDIIPNFGDYTDNYVANGYTLYVAWSDGRLGDPQPFEAHVAVH
jgi:hypothetical protein